MAFQVITAAFNTCALGFRNYFCVPQVKTAVGEARLIPRYGLTRRSSRMALSSCIYSMSVCPLIRLDNVLLENKPLI